MQIIPNLKKSLKSPINKKTQYLLLQFNYAMLFADPRGNRDITPTPSGSKFFNFHAAFGKSLQNNRSAHPLRELASLSHKYPGSVTVLDFPYQFEHNFVDHQEKNWQSQLNDTIFRNCKSFNECLSPPRK